MERYRARRDELIIECLALLSPRTPAITRKTYPEALISRHVGEAVTLTF